MHKDRKNEAQDAFVRDKSKILSHVYNYYFAHYPKTVFKGYSSKFSNVKTPVNDTLIQSSR